jgi:allantoicase
MTDFTEMVNLASERLGAAVLAASDEFFAPKEAMLKPGEPEWREDAYTERGKWMDGWETIRRRNGGYDWAIVRLGVPGVVRGVVVDTRWFRGNYPEQCSIEGCELPGVPTPEELQAAQWAEILPKSDLEGNAENRFEIDRFGRVTHLRLSIFPDGGVARFRAYGDAQPDFPASVRRGGEIDLAAMENGGWTAGCSDRFYGHPENLLLPGRSLFMGDGWETQRRRGPGHDWAIVRLAAPGRIHRIELDTDHFKGNSPDRCWIEGLYAASFKESQNPAESQNWQPLLAETKLQPHARFRWEDEVLDAGPVTHVRLNIAPDGGVARLRLFGTLADRNS